jgi:5-methyltetrahydrofolate--homocysteine methyltransferase/ATP-dependent helicase HrpA
MSKPKNYAQEKSAGMHGNASARKFKFARGLRKSMTETETILWSKLKNKQLEGLKFRRQHPYGRFVLDFYCHSLKLCVKIDGEVHQEKMNVEYDVVRTKMLKDNGIEELRFTNQEVKQNLEIVLDEILKKSKQIKSKKEN